MNIGLAGYGKMGSGIFRFLSGSPHSLTVLCIDEKEASSAAKKYTRRLERALKAGQMSPETYASTKESRRFTWRPSDLAGSEMVIEAIYENPEAKNQLLMALENVVPPDAILVSNTSSISIATLAKSLRHPERFCGMHFFYPVELINLVEILQGPDTSPGLPNRLKSWCRELGKNAVLALDAQGSVVNAILAYYYLEALYLLEEGFALPSQIDAIARSSFYVGPCESIDVIGVDFLLSAMRRSEQPGSLLPIDWKGEENLAIPAKDKGKKRGLRVPILFEKLISCGRLGKKVSRGIFLYEGHDTLDDEDAFYASTSRAEGAAGNPRRAEMLSKRLLYALFNGTLYSLQLGKASLEDLDLAVKEVLLMQQGPFSMMREIGFEKVRQEFGFLANHVGERFRITDLDLLRAALS